MTLEEFKEIEKEANNNDALAINKLALCYEDGEFVEKSESKTIELLEKSISLGCPNAMVNLAQRIFEYDKSRALKLLNQAAEMGFFGAYFILGLFSEKFDEKLKFYSKSAELGYPTGCFYSGSMYYQMGALNEAVKYWKLGADLNDSECWHNLAIVHAKDFKDFEKAAFFSKKAFENGKENDDELYEYFSIWSKIIHFFSNHKQEVKYWTNKKGFSDKIFTVSISAEQDINELSLLVLAPRYDESTMFPVSHAEVIKCKDFVKAMTDWDDYKTGIKSLKDIHPTQKAKYIVSILHYMGE